MCYITTGGRAGGGDEGAPRRRDQRIPTASGLGGAAASLQVLNPPPAALNPPPAALNSPPAVSSDSERPRRCCGLASGAESTPCGPESTPCGPESTPCGLASARSCSTCAASKACWPSRRTTGRRSKRS
eukprot:1191569-Prorocentrum_minimum.AAC.1